MHRSNRSKDDSQRTDAERRSEELAREHDRSPDRETRETLRKTPDSSRVGWGGDPSGSLNRDREQREEIAGESREERDERNRGR
ncbi:MAG: hypothetical protein WBX15_07775 [Thermoanaerobaculia bacterium]